MGKSARNRVRKADSSGQMGNAKITNDENSSPMPLKLANKDMNNQENKHPVQSFSKPSLDSQLSLIEARALEVQNRLKDLSSRNDALREQRNEARDQATHLQAKLDALTADSNEKATSEAQLHQEIATLREQQLQLEATLAHREKRLTMTEKEAKEQVAQAIAEAEERVEKAEAAVEKAEKEAIREIGELKKQLATKNEQEDRKRAENMIEELKAQLEERRAAVKAGDFRVARLEGDVAQLKKKLDKAQALAKNNDNAALDLENQLSLAEKKLEEYTVNEVAKVEEIDALKKMVDELEASVSDGASALESREWRIEDLLAQVNDMRDAYNELQGAYDVAVEEKKLAKHELQKVMSLRKSEVEESLQTLKTLEMEVNRLRKASANEKMEGMALREEVDVLRMSQKSGADEQGALVAKANFPQKAAIQKSMGHIAVIKQLERQVVDAEECLATIKAEYAATRSSLEAEISCLKGHVASNEAEIAHYKKTIHTLESVGSETVGKSEEMLKLEKQCVATLEDQVSQLAKLVEDKESDLQSKEWRIDDLVAQVNGLKEAAMEAEGRRATAEERFQASIEQYAKREEELLAVGEQEKRVLENTLYREIEEMKKKLEGVIAQGNVRVAAFEKDIQQATKRIDTLTEERTALMGAIDELQNALERQEKLAEQQNHVVDGLKVEVSKKRQQLKEAENKNSQIERLIDGLMVKKMRESSKENGGEKKRALQSLTNNVIVGGR